MAQLTDKQIIESAEKADREQIVAALARWHGAEKAEPRRLLISEIETTDPDHPFHPEAEKFVVKALAALDHIEGIEMHRTSLRAMFRWNRAARLALEDGAVSDSAVAALLGDPLAAP